MRLAIFDLDGTVIRSFMREGGGHSAYDLVEPLPGRQEHLAELFGMGVRVAYVTNQGGVAFGYQTPAQVMRKMNAVVAALGVPASLYVAFDHPKASIDRYRRAPDDSAARRKPNPTMLHEAAEQAGRSLRDDGVFVGDMESDFEAAERAGVEFRWASEFFEDAT